MYFKTSHQTSVLSGEYVPFFPPYNNTSNTNNVVALFKESSGDSSLAQVDPEHQCTTEFAVFMIFFILLKMPRMGKKVICMQQ